GRGVVGGGGADGSAVVRVQSTARLCGRGGRSVPLRASGAPGRSAAHRDERPVSRHCRRPGHPPSGGQMIRINLLPAEDAVRAAGRRHDVALGVLVLAMATFGLIVAHTWQHARVAAAEREQRRITQELVAIQGPYADVTRIEQQKQELREKLRVIAELEARKVGPVRLLEDLSGATPDKLWLLEFADTGGAVKISGLGVDRQTIADFLGRPARAPYFRRCSGE